MQSLLPAELERIHEASLRILAGTGVAFHDTAALDTFRKHGFRVVNGTVFFTEDQIGTALSHAPSSFTVYARNSEKDVIIGGDRCVFVPAYGAPFIAMPDGSQRQGTMEDYRRFCKLVQTSAYIDMNGYLMVEPGDVDQATAGLDMVLANMLYSDKPFMGCQTNRKLTGDFIEMLAIAFCDGEKAKVKEKARSVSLINALTPLQYSEEMAGSLIELAKHGQPVVIANMAIGGTTGPIPLAGILTLVNAEILAGIALAQLVNPGAPVIYGSTSTITNFRTGAALVGVPEQAQLISLTAQMSRYYDLPCRSGGGLCDAHTVDAQAGYEGGMNLLTAVNSGVNFILHSCGQMAGHMSMSYEKFLIDEEYCGMLKKVMQPVEVSDETVDVATISEIGVGGQYLTHPKTFKLCRSEYFQPALFSHANFDAWTKGGKQRVDEVARTALARRLEEYVRPELDPVIRERLIEHVNRCKESSTRSS